MLARAAALSRRWIGTAGEAERSTRAAAMSLYVGGVIAAGGALLVQFAPRTYPHPWMALTLLLAALVLSVFKLRLPLGRGNSTMSMAYAVDFAALMMIGSDLAMVIAAAGVLTQCTVRVKRRQPRLSHGVQRGVGDHRRAGRRLGVVGPRRQRRTSASCCRWSCRCRRRR